MLFALILSRDYTISTEADLYKITENPNASFVFLNDVKATKPFVIADGFSGMIDGRNHTLTLQFAGFLFTSVHDAYFRNLRIVSRSAGLVENAQTVYFKRCEFDTSYLLFGKLKNSNIQSTKFTYTSTTLINDSIANSFSGLTVYGEAPFMNSSSDDTLVTSFFNVSVTFIEQGTAYGAVASRLNSTDVRQTKIAFAAFNDAADYTNDIGGIAGFGVAIKVSEVDVYSNISIRSLGHVGGMLANIQAEKGSYYRSVHIQSSSIAVDFALDARGNGSFCRGGVVGFNVDKDLVYSYITIYMHGSLVSPTEQPEIFGGFIGYDQANGDYKYIYIFGQMTFKGCSTTAAGLIGYMSSDTTAYTQISHSVANIDFSGVISDNANIAGLIGYAAAFSKLTACSTHGVFNFEIDYFEKGYIAFSGIVGVADNKTELLEMYSTLNMNIYSKNHSQVGQMYVGGIVGNADDGSIIACAYYADYITIDNSFQRINLGGIAAIVDAYLNTYETWVNIKQVTVGSCDTVVEHNLGGGIGYSDFAFNFITTFVKVSFITGASAYVSVGAAVGLCDDGRRKPNFEYCLFSMVSKNKTNVSLVNGLYGNRISKETYMECVASNNVNMSDENCNNTNMHSADIIANYDKQLWAWNANYNDYYPHLSRALIRANNGSLVLPNSSYYYNSAYYRVESGLVFSSDSFALMRGAADGTAYSPVNVTCNYVNQTTFCVDHPIDKLAERFCVNSSGYMCINNTIYCNSSAEFFSGGCYPRCSTTCIHGECMNSKCVCDSQYEGTYCDYQDCSLSDSPCFGIASCVDHKCRCKDSSQYAELTQQKCVTGCDGLKHGICLGPNNYVCDMAFVTKNKPCDSCAEGYYFLGSACVTKTSYGGIVAGIVVGVILLAIIIAGVVWFVLREQRKRKEGKRYSKINGDTFVPRLGQEYEMKQEMGYEQF